MTLSGAVALAREADLTAIPGQDRTTRERLIPRIAEILEKIRRRRAEVDADFERLRKNAGTVPTMHGEARVATYPVGFCLPIRDRVFDKLAGDPGFRRLIGEGTVFRKVHILLRGAYFQNAMQLGNLYVDAANDTVDIRKDQLDWAPIGAVDYANCESWTGVAAVAKRYLGVELYPNLSFPLLFPAAPFFMIRPSGRIDLFQHPLIFTKDVGEGMKRVGTLLDDPEFPARRLPEVYERKIREAFGSNLKAAFPFAYEPSTTERLREVTKEFAGLATMPEPAAFKTLSHYLATVTEAETGFFNANLVAPPEELEALRRSGAAPSPAFVKRPGE